MTRYALEIIRRNYPLALHNSLKKKRLINNESLHYLLIADNFDSPISRRREIHPREMPTLLLPFTRNLSGSREFPINIGQSRENEALLSPLEKGPFTAQVVPINLAPVPVELYSAVSSYFSSCALSPPPSCARNKFTR